MPTTIYVLAEYDGGIPDYGYRVFSSLEAAEQARVEIVDDWNVDGELEDDGPGYWRAGDRELRMTTETLDPHEELRLLLAAQGVPTVVSTWEGAPDDETWGDPVYVTRVDVADVSAVADLGAAPLSDQADYLRSELTV